MTVWKRCSCGREWRSRFHWKIDTRPVGFQDVEEEGDQGMEIRNCRCGTTTAVERDGAEGMR